MMNLQEEMLRIKNEMIDEFDKRVEALKEEEQEFPQDGDVYWYINPLGFAFHDEWSGFITEVHKIEIGNVFKTKEQADFAVEKLKVEAELRKFSRTFMWGTENTAMLFDGDNIKFDTRLSHVFQGAIYFESENKAKEAIEAVGEDRIKKYIFGVEGLIND
ncbi:hypothetical protein ACN2AU_08120 [Aerococcus viridans]